MNRIPASLKAERNRNTILAKNINKNKCCKAATTYCNKCIKSIKITKMPHRRSRHIRQKDIFRPKKGKKTPFQAMRSLHSCSAAFSLAIPRH